MNLQKYMAIRHKHQTDLAKDLKTHKANVSAWYNGARYPRPEMMAKIAKYLGVTVSDLTAAQNETSSRAVRIPVFGSIAAGIPIDMIEDIIDWEEIDEHTASKGAYFGLRVKGNSMEPRICDGDIVIVRQQDDAESGDVVICAVNGDEATCKRLRKFKDGIELIPINPSYEPLFFSNEEILSRPVTILGKVIELRGKV